MEEERTENTGARERILSLLDEKGIAYQQYTHPRAYTMEECLAMPFLDPETTYCKNVFLSNRQQTQYYLMLLRPDTAFRTAVVSKALGVSRLSFAPETALPGLLHLTGGSVSPLGLFFAQEYTIPLCYETAVRATPRIAFHPCDNSATVVFAQEVFWERVVPLLKVQVVGIELA